jgi:two-component system cell cycle sensor histidine kinase/response regulator CckA
LNANHPVGVAADSEASVVTVGESARTGEAQTAQRSELETLRARVAELEVSQFLLEDQVRQLHRVKTVMDLLAGVAHDLSSALTGIVWCSEALQRRIAADSDLNVGLADFVGAAEYARKLARRLLTLGKPREEGFEPCSIQRVVADAAALVETLRPHTATLESELCAPDAFVFGNADQLQQVIVNLTTNAFDAVGKTGGTVRVRLDELPTNGHKGEPCWVRIRVEDTGDGMTPDTLRRAFEPFFTTKGSREGNGLGLVVVKTIVERHRGRIKAQSRRGHGTTIEVLLPRVGTHVGC